MAFLTFDLDWNISNDPEKQKRFELLFEISRILVRGVSSLKESYFQESDLIVIFQETLQIFPKHIQQSMLGGINLPKAKLKPGMKTSFLNPWKHLINREDAKKKGLDLIFPYSVLESNLFPLLAVKRDNKIVSYIDLIPADEFITINGKKELTRYRKLKHQIYHFYTPNIPLISGTHDELMKGKGKI